MPKVEKTFDQLFPQLFAASDVEVAHLLHAHAKKKYLQLREVAYVTGFTPQMVLNIINRYDVVNPKRTLNGKREIYVFTWDELNTLVDIKSLIDDGFSVGQAIVQLKVRQLPFTLIEKVRIAIDSRDKDVDEPAIKNGLTQTLTEIFTFIDSQMAIVFSEYHKGTPLDECCVKADLAGNTIPQRIEAARQKLIEAEAIIGIVFTNLYLNQNR